MDWKSLNLRALYVLLTLASLAMAVGGGADW